VRASAEAVRAARVLLAVEVLQGAIGFVQYFTDLPGVLVGFHMLGAALISATMTWLLLAVLEQPVVAPPVPVQAAGALPLSPAPSRPTSSQPGSR